MDVTKRLAKLRAYMDENGISAAIVVNPENQYYISGFKAILYSRPIVYILSPESTGLVIPALEEAHAAKEASADHLHVYYEHPEKAYKGVNWIDIVDKIISAYPKGAVIGVELDTLPVRIYRRLTESGYRPADIGKKITEMRYVKDKNEIEMLLKSAELVNLALRKTIENACAGISELQLDSYGDTALQKEVSMRYPEHTVDSFAISPSGTERTVMPHVFSNTRRLKKGDVIIHSRQVGLSGYRVENERTFFIGEPTKEQKRLFGIVYEAQKAARESIKPGMAAKEVDGIARKIIQEAGYGDYFIHRTGHGIGIGAHEEPSLRFDSDLVLEEDMVFSIEPAVFVPGAGGFRHSDTVILTKGGSKVITEYPRELEQLIF